MHEVVLTIGPQHIGKSTFVKKIIEQNPTITLVSRDAILMDLFGDVYLDSYSGGHLVALEKMWEIMEKHLEKENQTIILDCWNGPDNEREFIIRKLRLLKVAKIGGWYFKTPLKTCLGWYVEKLLVEHPIRNKWTPILHESRKDSFKECYNFFYENATVNQAQGFDFVVKINPLKSYPLTKLFREYAVKDKTPT